MVFVTSTSFSICVNGDVHGFFKGKRGLRQGDPLSPYLFTLVMEVLMLILHRHVPDSDYFRYHKQCEDIGLINVCFADDPFIFSRGDINSAKVIMDSLEEFKSVSGLVPSIPKSTSFFYNIGNHVKYAILNIMPFSEGKLSVIYLGVLLILKRLFIQDCKFLVKNVKNRIGDWKNKTLSYAGRLQLCKSVISSMHVYWALVLMIPTSFLLDIEQLICGFLWCNDLSWGWRKILQLHDLVRPFFGRRLEMVPVIDDSKLDTQCWHGSNGIMGEFSVQVAWEDFWPRGNEVHWFHIVWFTHNIPRHAFHVWLVMRKILKTQDKLRQWDIGNGTDLNLPIAHKRTTISIIGRLLFATSSYYIWTERNNRLFKKMKRPPEEIRDLIKVTMRLKLLSFNFKKRTKVEQLLSNWNMPKNFRLYGN
ncbi:hypothetical protein Tco_0414922 [Tanacetum coccineum]